MEQTLYFIYPNCLEYPCQVNYDYTAFSVFFLRFYDTLYTLDILMLSNEKRASVTIS